MRWLPLVVFAGCSFPHGSPQLTTDGQTGGDDASIGDPDSNDPGLDSPMAGPRVRSIAVSGAQVIGGPHVSFPMLVSLSGDWLRAQSSGGDVARDDGFDIYFSADLAGAQQLAHEVEVYAPATGRLLAWVKVPSLSSTTTIYIHYGDPALTTDPQSVSEVWSGFQGVYHLDVPVDATGKNGTTTAMTSGVVGGKINTASSFDGIDDQIDLGSGQAIDNLWAGGGTAEGWFVADTFGEGSYGRIFDKGHDNGWSLWVDNIDVPGSMAFLAGSTGMSYGFWSTPANTVTLGTWHHVAVVYDKGSTANDPVLYIDGLSLQVTRVNTPTGTMDDDSAITCRAGNRQGGDRTFDGLLDELRLSAEARSAGWIETSFRNQNDPDAFSSVSESL